MMGKTYRKEERKQHQQKKSNRKSKKRPIIPKYHYDDYVLAFENDLATQKYK